MNLLKKILFSIANNAAIPIKKEFPFFIMTMLMQLIPIFVNSHCNSSYGIFYIEIIKYEKYIPSIPYITYIPFIISYLFSIIIYSLEKRFFIISIYIKYLLYILFFVLDTINLFLLFHFQTFISPFIIQLIFETNHTESAEFLSNYLFANRSFYAYFILFIIALAIYCLEKNRVRISSIFNMAWVNYVICIIILLTMFSSYSPISKFIKMYSCNSTGEIETWYADVYNPDVSVITSTLYSLYFERISVNDYKRVIHLSEIAIKSTIKEKKLDSLDIVIIIGESFNKYHSSLYGYIHNTNPFLQKEKENSSLFAFKNVISPYNLTSSVIKNLFSTNSIMNGELWYNYPLFPTIFKSAGYKVFFWDNQKSGGRSDAYDFSLNSFLYNKKTHRMSYDRLNERTFKFDGELIEDFIHFSHLLSKDNLVIFHLNGQHLSASERFPKKKIYNLYNIDSIKNNSLNKIQKKYIADYDNATLYNDFVVESIINIFRQRNAIILYFSDHGEEVYDYRNLAGRSHENAKTSNIMKYQYEIPFVIWCSQSYIQKNKNIIASIKKSLNKPYMIDNLSHLLFYLGNIHTKYYNYKYNLIDNNYKCKKRIVQDHYNYDVIIKRR